MKDFQEFISKLGSIEKHESIFGNLCMKKGGSFQIERFKFFFKSSMGGEGQLTPKPPSVRTPLVAWYLIVLILLLCSDSNRF